MIVIKIDQRQTKDPGTSIVTFAKTLEEVGERSIRAINGTFGTKIKRLTYYPAQDRDAYIDSFDGQVVQTGPSPTHYNVYAKETVSLEDTTISGIFVDTMTPEDLEKTRPHTVKISGDNARDHFFPSLYSADLFCEEYGETAASRAETLEIVDQNGQTIKTY